MKRETLLKITQVGICGTDIHPFLGIPAFFKYLPILGHALAAKVDKNEKIVVVDCGQ